MQQLKIQQAAKYLLLVVLGMNYLVKKLSF